MNSTLTYKGYTGSIDFSLEDNCLYGKVMGIDDLVSFEGRTVAEIKQDFETAVDDYLQMCAELGKQPQKAYKGTFNVRVSPELHRRAALEAAKEKQSLNWVVGKAIEEYLAMT